MSTPLPIRELKPKDFGGIVARSGFGYQDHVATKFCLEMLLGDKLQEVWCETYDDIVLVWQESCEATGQLVTLQIKSGPSYFEQVTKNRGHFR